MNSANFNLDTAKTLLLGMAKEAAELQAALGAPATDVAAGWLVSKYIVAAHEKLAGADGVQRWEILRAVVQDLSLLRRGDHSAARLQLEREELDFQRTNSQTQKEKEFWEWLERPEIRAKVFPNKERGLSRETIEKIERELNLL